MTDNGWVCLHRSILDWEWYDDANATRLFIHCLLRANHAPKKWKGIDIKRGQFWTSLESLSNETGLSVKQVRTALEKLASELASSGQARGRMITVINYEKYQEKGRPEGRMRAGSGQAEGKLRATNNNDNNENNENNGTKRSNGGKPPSVVTEKILVDDFKIPKQVAKDFITVRKAKRLPLTPTAWQSMLNEFGKAGLDVADGVELCVKRGWGAFKSTWDWQGSGRQRSHQQEETIDERVSRMTIARFGNDGN